MDNTKLDTFIGSITGGQANDRPDPKAEAEKRRKEQIRIQASKKLKQELSKPKPNTTVAKNAAADIVGSILDENILNLYVVEAIIGNDHKRLIFKNEKTKGEWVKNNWDSITHIKETTLHVPSIKRNILENTYKNLNEAKKNGSAAVVGYLMECSKTSYIKPFKNVLSNDTYTFITSMIEKHGNPNKWVVESNEYETLSSNHGKIAEWLKEGTAKHIKSYAQKVYNSLY
jgi:hypothetical protein